MVSNSSGKKEWPLTDGLRARGAQRAGHGRPGTGAAELRTLRELCHDLTVPATSIRLLAQAAAAEPDPLPSMRERLRQIASEASTIADICSYVLEQPGADKTAELHVLAAEVADTLRSRYAGVIELSADAVTAAAHPVAVTRILSNVIDNACRAAGPGGRVRLTVQRDGDQATLAVTDSGRGFGHARSGKASLGLGIVASMVRRSGGTLRIGAGDPGGMAVTVSLPAARRAGRPRGLVPGQTNGMKIVICDAHRVFADALAFLLRGAGHEIGGIASGLGEATLPADACVFALEGPHAAKRAEIAQAVAAAQGTAFVALGGSADPSPIRQALAAGVRGVALKSDDFCEFLEVLTNAGATRPVPQGAAAAAALSASARAALRRADGLDAGPSQFLTQREREVLGLLVRGAGTSDIARELGVRTSTARSHIDAVLTKLGAHTRLEAVACAVREGLVDMAGWHNEQHAVAT